MYRNKLWQPPKYNCEGRTQLWVDACLQTHDSWCGCDSPAIHLLSCLLPPGHKDRGFTVEELITRQQCHFGGAEEKDGGQTEDLPTREEETTAENLDAGFSDAAIDELLAAAAEDVEPR